MANLPWLDLSDPEAARLDWRRLAEALADHPPLAEQAAQLAALATDAPANAHANHDGDEVHRLTDVVVGWLRQAEFLDHWRQAAATTAQTRQADYWHMLAQRCREQSQKFSLAAKQTGGVAGMVGRLAGLAYSRGNDLDMLALTELLHQCQEALEDAAQLANDWASQTRSVSQLWHEFTARVPTSAYPPLHLLDLPRGLLSRLLLVDRDELLKLTDDTLAHTRTVPPALRPLVVLTQVLLTAREPGDNGPSPAEWCPVLSLPPLTPLRPPPPLERLRTRLGEMVWACAPGCNPLADARAELASWLETPDGEEWLHQLASAAVAPSEDTATASASATASATATVNVNATATVNAADTATVPRDAARAWVGYLLAHRFVQIYPCIDPDTWAVNWPAGTPTGAGVTYDFADVPPGQLVRVQRYAPTPQQAACTISLGPTRPNSALHTAHHLVEVCTQTHWLTAKLHAPAEALLGAAVAAELGRQPVKPVQALLIDALDGLVEAIEAAVEREPDSEPGHLIYLAAEDAALLQQAHRSLCELARAWDFSVVPESVPWGHQPPESEQSARSDAACGSDWPEAAVERAYYYREAPMGQLVRVRRFGLLAQPSGQVIRSASLIISAGPMPMGFERLYQLVNGQPGGEALRQRLRDWPQASVESRLEEAATQLFIDYWGEPGQPFREQARAASEDFAQVLASLLDVFGMQTFSPSYFQDVPTGWARLNSERRMTSGRVVEVLRPGLQDHQGHLLVPAIIEVE
jgi:hypothetical protein